MSMERPARLVLLPELELVESVKLSNRILGLLKKQRTTLMGWREEIVNYRVFSVECWSSFRK